MCVCVCVCVNLIHSTALLLLAPILNTLSVVYYLTCLSSSDHTDDNKGNP